MLSSLARRTALGRANECEPLQVLRSRERLLQLLLEPLRLGTVPSRLLPCALAILASSRQLRESPFALTQSLVRLGEQLLTVALQLLLLRLRTFE